MHRPHNFSAGPAALPESVLTRVAAELDDWRGSGLSVMTVSHRGRDFVETAQSAEADLRTLLAVPDDYAVLFMQGGATAQFAAVPLNLGSRGGRAAYLDTGHWSTKAIAEARRYLPVEVVASGRELHYRTIPPETTWAPVSRDAAYLHYTPNETVHGLEFHHVPQLGEDEAPLVADVSSTLLSRPLDVSRFGVLYAGAQKNIGPAGLTLVIVRRDLMDDPLATAPTLYTYRAFADSDSMINTPPTFAWYVAGLVFRWLLDEVGGLEAMAAINRRKAATLYGAIDRSSLYSNPVDPDHRSWMNAVFTLQEPDLERRFLAEAEAAGFVGLKGHRAVGGLRASLYNALPEASVEALVDFMAEFERRWG